MYDTKLGDGHSVKLVCNYLLYVFIITVVLVLLSLLWAILCGPLLPLVILARCYCIDEPTVIRDEHLGPIHACCLADYFHPEARLGRAQSSCRSVS